MPKVNTILNYFTSPKTVKKSETKEERGKSQTPKREQKNKGSICKNCSRESTLSVASNDTYEIKMDHSLIRNTIFHCCDAIYMKRRFM